MKAANSFHSSGGQTLNTVTHLEDLPSYKLTLFNTIEALTLQAAPGSCRGGVETLPCRDIHVLCHVVTSMHIHEWKLCHAVTSRKDAAWHRGSTYVAQFSTNQENLAEQKVEGNVLTNAVLGGKCRK